MLSDLGPGDKAAVMPLEHYTRTLDDSVGTRTTDRTIAVTLSSDVTFEYCQTKR